MRNNAKSRNKWMRIPLTVAALILCATSAQAGHVPAAPGDGPITALQKLESLQQSSPSSSSRRHVSPISWQTTKGTRVLFVQANELPMLDVRLVFDAGAARDGRLSGLASLTSRMLDEGTPTLNVDQISTRVEQLGASLSASSYRDMAVVDLRVLSAPEWRDPALTLLTDVVAHATFPDKSYARMREQTRIGHKQRQQSLSSLAQLRFDTLAYGDHPYSTPITGTRDSISRVRIADMKRFHETYYVARNLVIAMVGDLDEASARKISENISAALPEGARAPDLPLVADTSAVEQHVEYPSTQTHILIGAPFMRRDDPDRYAFAVANEVLGGGNFTSLLNQEIRQKRGLAYSIYSQSSPMRAKGPFLISLQTRNEQAANAVQVVRETVDGFLRRGPSEQQLQDAKRAIVQSFPLAVAENSSILGMLGAIGFYDLPIDYIDRYVDTIEAVTMSDVQRVLARLDSTHFITVTAGQSAAPAASAGGDAPVSAPVTGSAAAH